MNRFKKHEVPIDTITYVDGEHTSCSNFEGDTIRNRFFKLIQTDKLYLMEERDKAVFKLWELIISEDEDAKPIFSILMDSTNLGVEFK